jgi:hypothetical protein
MLLRTYLALLKCSPPSKAAIACPLRQLEALEALLANLGEEPVQELANLQLALLLVYTQLEQALTYSLEIDT